MLKEPFPSSPSRNPIHVLYISKGEKENIQTFAATYSTKKFVEAILEDDEWVLETSQHLKASSGIHIRCSEMKAIMEYKYTPEEKAWELPHPYPREAFAFRHGRLPNAPERAPERVTAPKKPRVPRASREGLISIGDLAEELNMKPRDARGILRKAKLEKPACGWAWSKEDAEDIRDLIRRSAK